MVVSYPPRLGRERKDLARRNSKSTGRLWRLLYAPAKINLSLRIIGRRSDGYHLLDSVMLPLDLCDRVRVELSVRRGIRLSCPGFASLEGRDNLAWRAADLYLRHSRWPVGVKITLGKKIPLAAGLGGASSDAAAVLRALDQMNPAPLGDKSLYLLAEELGADVPFFLKASPCRAQGVGNVLFPLRLRYRPWVLLACAPFGLLTKEVYHRYDQLAPKPGSFKKRLTPTGDGAIKPSPVRPAGVELFAAAWRNDLQQAAISLAPAIEDVVSALRRAGVKAARLTGSGPTVFGLCRTEAKARKTADCARLPSGWKIIICRVLNTGGAQETH